MNKLLLTGLLFLLMISEASSQLVRENFTGVITPQYICSGGTTRLPYVYRATVSGLLPNTTYRYYAQACRYTDFGSTNSGAGNPIFIHGTDFRFSSSTGLSTAGGYDSMMTDATGSYTGWFGFVHTGNARFTPGNYVYPSITLDSGGNGSTEYRFALNDSILVLGFSDSATSTSGTGIYGISMATPKNISALYDNINGTGRPLSIVYVENSGIDTSAMTSIVPYYKDSVATRNGRFGMVIPNLLPSGVRRVNILRLSDASIASYQIDSDGIWPSGTNTVNPNGGSANPLRLIATDIPLVIKNENIMPSEFSLGQNYPNPFNPVTSINFMLPSSGNVKMKLYDMLGKEIKNLTEGFYDQGSYNLSFDGSALNSGVYVYAITFTSYNGSVFNDSKKLMLIK